MIILQSLKNLFIFAVSRIEKYATETERKDQLRILRAARGYQSRELFFVYSKTK